MVPHTFTTGVGSERSSELILLTVRSLPLYYIQEKILLHVLYVICYGSNIGAIEHCIHRFWVYCIEYVTVRCIKWNGVGEEIGDGIECSGMVDGRLFVLAL